MSFAGPARPRPPRQRGAQRDPAPPNKNRAPSPAPPHPPRPFAALSIIDRSDWQELYNLGRDDGVSFLPEAAGAPSAGLAASMKASYNAVVADLREALTQAPTLRALAGLGRGSAMAGGGLMLLNAYGNARLDQFRPFDGQFAEGSAVAGLGLLGVASPAILWTYSFKEVSSAAGGPDAFFQAHLYMGVCPMIPFPANDHSISWSDDAIAAYTRYGFLFTAVANKVWLLAPHIAGVVNGTGLAAAKTNAFVTVLDAAAPPAALQQALVLPVVLASSANGTALLNLTGYDRAWAEPHPLLRHRRAAAGLAPWARAPAQLACTFEYAPPGGAAWAPLAPDAVCGGGAPCNAALRVPLSSGAALVRVRCALKGTGARGGVKNTNN